MTARAIISAAILTAFVIFVPIEDVSSPAFFLMGLLGLFAVIAIETIVPAGGRWRARFSAWLFLLALLVACTGVVINFGPRNAHPIEPEEDISSASLRV